MNKVTDQQGRAGSRIANIDALRALAALAVCLFHFTRSGFLGDNILSQICRQGYLGVDAFFVISGFVIPWSLHQSRYEFSQLFGFLSRRFWRLYPAYVVTGVLTLGLWYASSLVPGFRGAAPHLEHGQLWGNLALACAFNGTEWLVPVFWTLAIEVQFYVLVAVMFPLLVHRRPIVRFISLAAWVGVVWCDPSGNLVLAYGALFGLGITLFLRTAGCESGRASWFWVGAATVSLFWVRGIGSALVGLVSYLVLSCAPAVRLRGLLFVGSFSYSLYLLHIPLGSRIINLAERLPMTLGYRGAAVLLALGVAMVGAYLLFLLVERPSHQIARRFGNRWQSQLAPDDQPKRV